MYAFGITVYTKAHSRKKVNVTKYQQKTERDTDSLRLTIGNKYKYIKPIDNVRGQVYGIIDYYAL